MSAEGAAHHPVAKALHWAIVVVVAIEFLLGWIMPELRRSATPDSLVNLHMSFGVLILPAAALLLFMRFARPAVPVESGPLWQRRAASLTHLALYACLVAVPLTGWTLASSRGYAVTLFGLFDLPALSSAGSSLGRALGELHGALTTVIGLLIIGHGAAALYHHFLVRDGVLLRMLPMGKKESRRDPDRG